MLPSTTGRELFNPSTLIEAMRRSHLTYLDRVYGYETEGPNESRWVKVELVEAGFSCDAVIFIWDEVVMRVIVIPQRTGELIITAQISHKFIKDVRFTVPFNLIGANDIDAIAEGLTDKIRMFIEGC